VEAPLPLHAGDPGGTVPTFPRRHVGPPLMGAPARLRRRWTTPGARRLDSATATRSGLASASADGSAGPGHDPVAAHRAVFGAVPARPEKQAVVSGLGR
jgi:hypothetical protein